MLTCGAKNRRGTPCELKAGFGTDHVGVGRCKFHGGLTPIKHGLYSKVVKKQTLGEMWNQRYREELARVLGRLEPYLSPETWQEIETAAQEYLKKSSPFNI